MQIPNETSALVFDLYGTIVDTGSVTAACERIFPGRGAELSTAWRATQLEYTWLLNSMGNYLDFAEVTRRALSHSCRSARLPCNSGDERDLLEAFMDLAPFGDSESALRILAGRGFRLYVLTNGTRQMAEETLRRAELLTFVSEVLSVDSVSVYKPDPRVYQLATEHLSLPAADVGFVSANSWDIAGAAASGLRSIWINRGGDVPSEIGPPPVTVIPSLTELSDLVVDDGR